MIPFAGLSLVVHAFVLLIKFLGKTLGISNQKTKAYCLRRGLAISPRLSMSLFGFNSSWRPVASVLIIAAIFSFVLLNNFVLLRITLRDSIAGAFLADTFKSSWALAGQKNTEVISQSGPAGNTHAPTLSLASEPDMWLAAQYQSQSQLTGNLSIDNLPASKYYKQSGLKPVANKKILLDKN